MNTVTRNVNFFRTPEERELLLDQLFEDVIFLLIVASHVDRLTKKHRFFELIIFGLKRWYMP